MMIVRRKYWSCYEGSKYRHANNAFQLAVSRLSIMSWYHPFHERKIGDASLELWQHDTCTQHILACSLVLPLSNECTSGSPCDRINTLRDWAARTDKRAAGSTRTNFLYRTHLLQSSWLIAPVDPSSILCDRGERQRRYGFLPGDRNGRITASIFQISIF